MHIRAFFVATFLFLHAGSTEAQQVQADPGEDAVPEGQVQLPPDCPLGKVQGSFARKAAGKWFAKGELLVSEERYEEAVAAFMCSFKLVEHPNTLFNTAQAAMLLGNTDLALTMLRRYVQEAPDGPMAEDAAQRIADLERQKKEAEPLPPPPVPEPPPEPEVAPPPPQPLPPPQPARRVWQKPLGIGAIGLSGAVAVTGVVLHALAGAAKSEGQSTDDYHVFEQQKDKMNGLQTGAFVCYGTAVVAVVAGVVLLAIDDAEKLERTLTIGPAARGAGLAWEF